MTEQKTDGFDVDRCVDEDGGLCEVQYGGSPSVWKEAIYIGKDQSRGGHVFRYDMQGGYGYRSPGHIRNIQPKPRTAKVYVFKAEGAEPFLSLHDAMSNPVSCVKTITINLDTFEQVEPDVMTVDELRTEHLIYIELDGGRWRICQCIPIAVWDGVKMNPSHDSSRYFDTHRAAQIEATRIAREGKHNA
jgi:hypothetical protein